MDGEWRVMTIGDLAAVRSERVMPSPGSDEPYVGLEHIEAESGRLIGVGRAGDTVSLKTPFQAGDILYGKLRPALRKVLRAPICGLASTEILAVVPKLASDGPFVKHILHSDQVLSWALQGAEGTKMPRTSWQRLSAFKFLCPPPGERAAIARVLDAIDEAIEKTEAVIAATEQVRKALLQELLTRGVPGWHTEWKTVPGIGTIPACWEVVRLGEVVTIKSGQEDPRDPELANRLFVAPDDVESETRALVRRRTVAEARAISGKYAFDAEDVVYSKIRPYLRKVFLPGETGLCSADMYPIRPLDCLDRVFLSWLLLSESLTRYVATCSDRTGIPKVNREGLLAYRFGMPSLAEQQRIAKAIESVAASHASARLGLNALKSLKADAAAALLSGRVRVPNSKEKRS
jgi:type I restriction enzyme S subunit